MRFAQVDQTIKLLLVVFLLGRTACYIVDSFSWPMDGDLNFLYYISWLINEHDFVPYRDVHETSFFGTFIFYSALTKLIGYSIAAFHVADTVYFSLLSILMYFLLRPFGKLTGLLAIGLFGEFYYQYGAGVHLQRDFVALLPVALAMLLAAYKNIFNPRVAFFLIGALFGVASCIKPQFGLGMALVVPLCYLQHSSDPSLRWKLLYESLLSLVGFVCIWILGLSWLYWHGVLNNFFDMVFNYLPQYSSINGRNYARTNEDAFIGAVKWFSGTAIIFLLPLLLAVFNIYRETERTGAQKVLATTVILMWLLYLAYVPMAGKYWQYHIVPSCYFLAMGLSFMLAQLPSANTKSRFAPSFFYAWLIMIWLTVLQQTFFIWPVNDAKYNQRIKIGTEELAEYLSQHLQAGDTIQSDVSHTHGPIFPALLKIGAMPATPYLENYLLYHDIDKPFVKHAREQFLSTLQNRPPHYIIAGPTVFNFSGKRTEQKFQLFEDWLAQHYHPVFYSRDQAGQGVNELYTVYEYNGR